MSSSCGGAPPTVLYTHCTSADAREGVRAVTPCLCAWSHRHLFLSTENPARYTVTRIGIAQRKAAASHLLIISSVCIAECHAWPRVPDFARLRRSEALAS